MRLAIDTNTYVEAARGAPRAMQLLRQTNEIYLPFVVLAELRAGFAVGSQGLKNEAKLIEFLNSPRAHPLFPDEQTTHHYAGIFSQLKKQGTPVPTNDLWIAALVLQHDLILYSQDKHFARIPRLVLIS